MQLLHEVSASLGTTLVYSLNQPSSFVWPLLDQVLMLSNGLTCYHGAAAGYGERASFGAAESSPSQPCHQAPARSRCLEEPRSRLDSFHSMAGPM